jgi:predicted NBD/HSP70 family sugar kinase
MRSNLQVEHRLAGIGVAVPGQVRVSDGVIRYAPQLKWVEAAFGPALSQATSLPVMIANDASLGCMAERNFGSARGFSEVVFLFAGSGGIGGGAIVHGRQLTGAAGYAGELGHVKIATSDQRDYSGFSGTLEALVKRDDLLETFGLAVASDEELEKLVHDAQKPQQVALIEKQIDALADGISNFVTIFNPQAVVLGGFLNSLFNYDANRLLNRIRSSSVQASAERVLIRQGALGSNLMMVGAAELPLASLIREPSSYQLTPARDEI